MSLLHARWPLLVVTLASVAIYLGAQNDQGWIPHDEGLLGQSATRVLEGELPHLDFDDPYTGGQAMLHALAMKALGVNSLAMRAVLHMFSVGLAAAAFLIAIRFVPAWCAALVTWLAIAWSVPNYFAPLPSWYNLCFAAFGTLALIKFDETSRLRWLVLAGVMGGLSFLIKVAGLYYIAAGLLYLVYRDQQLVGDESLPQRRKTWFSAFVTMSLVCFTAMLLMLVRSRPSLMDLIHFVMPGAALAGFLIINQFRQGSGTSTQRMKRLTLVVTTFLAAASVPVLIFLIPYAAAGGIGTWLEGVFVLPQKRMQFADYAMPPTSSLVAVIPYALLLIVPMMIGQRLNQIWLTASAWIVCVFAILVSYESPVYGLMWDSTRPLIPLVTLVSIVMLLRTPTSVSALTARERMLFLLLAMAAMTSLVQFPYSFAIYFCYAAPIVILAIVAAVMKQDRPPIQLHLSVAMFFLGVALLWLNHGRVQRIGVRYVADDQNTTLSLPRCGLRVSAGQAKLYTDVVKSIQEHSRDGAAIYATVDCPEIYFLANRRNPTRSFYEFFESDYLGDLDKRITRIVKMLDENDIEVVVFHWRGEFSGPLPIELAQSLVSRFPNVEHFTRETAQGVEPEPTFSVAWK